MWQAIKTRNVSIRLLLLAVALFWGLGYPLMKIAITEVEVFKVLWIRFFLASMLMLPFCTSSSLWSKKLLSSGVVLGTILFFSFALIILGLERTTATSTGFLSALFVLWVPILSKIFLKQSLSARVIFAIPVSMLGILCLFGMRISTLHYGEMMVISGSVLTAIHILLIEKYSKLYKSIELTFVQFFVVAIWSVLFSWLMYDSFSVSLVDIRFVVSMVLLVFFSTLLAFWIQTKYQSYISPAKAALIFNAEPLFSTFFAVLILDEILGVGVYIGGALIMLSIVVSQEKTT